MGEKISDSLINKIDFLERYRDFIDTYEKIYHIKSNDSIEDLFNNIISVLIDKYRIPPLQLIKSFLYAIYYNYRCMEQYITIINKIITKCSLVYKCIYRNKEIDSYLNATRIFSIKKLQFSTQFFFDENSFPKENDINYIVMHDQIDKFKKYTVENTLHHVLIKILSDYSVPLLEACCYYGSVNIFFFLISNLDFQINQKCFQYSFIGGNTDIINECMKNYNIDRNCLNDIVSCHNNQFLEYIFDDEIFQPQNFNITNIIMSQNLKAVYLLFKKDKNSIYPLCTAFSPTIDILNNEDIDLSKAYSDYSPMNYSAMYNTYEIAEFILSHGMKIKGTSYLFTAAQNNSIETAKVLISHGIDINGRDNIDRTALHIAAENNSKETAEFLIANGIDINARNSVSQTALHNATCSNSIEIAEILIKHGIDKNVRDSDSKTALYYAVINNYKEIARVLISPEIEFNYKYKNEETILHIALNHNYNEIAKMLITNGADVNIKNKNNESLLHIATDHNNKEIVELLISHGSNINAKDFLGKTALHNAIIKNYKDIAEILIAHGAQINEKDKWGKTTLHKAAHHNSRETAEVLIANGADINIKDSNGDSALHIATYHNSKETFEFLVSNNADINTVNNNGWTVLHAAAINNCLEIAEFIISHGVDLNLKDKKGKTALDYAKQYYNTKIKDILISHGASS